MDVETRVLDKQCILLSKSLEDYSLSLALLESCQSGRISVPAVSSLIHAEEDAAAHFERIHQMTKAVKDTVKSLKKILSKKSMPLDELDRLDTLLDSCGLADDAASIQLASRLLYRTSQMCIRRLQFY